MRRRNNMPTLIFDGECGFCTTSVNSLDRLFPNVFQRYPYQYCDVTSYNLTIEQCKESIWLIEYDYQGNPSKTAGAEALRRLVKNGGQRREDLLGDIIIAATSPFQFPPLSTAANYAYKLVAQNRRHLPGGTPACTPFNVRVENTPMIIGNANLKYWYH